ncbi:OsmC family protein [Sphingomonas nostoxanthinifaciens]|uniref:OsmC family protein n=1 Tax=Sphingomonas nostoxanthinifaciens TaxID=2872652 RepID=UPI001CC1C66A|nr:OsmC family protein [Sphingomonas nostoxanthinifaciens]UAK24101.1 OsmC family protein [Sphingomonas nostoxanthinifaciens]
MIGRRHAYRVAVDWSGATTGYRDYARDHVIGAEGCPDIAGSSDPAFRGDPTRWNPEQLLVASLAACHKLWFLHLAAEAGLVVTAYHDDAEGIMVEDGVSGRFERVVLNPRVTIASGDAGLLPELHHRAHEACFIARSVAFPVIVTQS